MNWNKGKNKSILSKLFQKFVLMAIVQTTPVVNDR